MTQIIRSLSEWRALELNGDLGFVPTMGCLHAGHVSLIGRARCENALTAVSIFVNPTQFNKASDLEAYPQPREADMEVLTEVGVDYALMPSIEELYPDGYRYRISESSQSELMEGKHRPGHFDGMLTVVLKLLMWTRPQRAYFGEKDYQQLQLVAGMAKAFFLDCEIVGCPTVREPDGLAMSSRNHNLNHAERARAALLPQILQTAPNVEAAREALTKNGFKVDYVEEHEGRRFVAASLGNVRLIDHVPIKDSLPAERVDRLL